MRRRGSIWFLVAVALLGRGSAAVGGATPPDDPVRVRYGWSEPRDCSKEAAVAGLTRDSEQPILRGRVNHHGAEPIRDVQVCVAGVCAFVAGGGVIAGGESGSFELHVKSRSAARVKPTLRCSVLEARAGA